MLLEDSCHKPATKKDFRLPLIPCTITFSLRLTRSRTSLTSGRLLILFVSQENKNGASLLSHNKLRPGSKQTACHFLFYAGGRQENSGDCVYP
jgi:hypothetical protein